jgi:CubicO group peptidase (beta-lactamase class C family)
VAYLERGWASGAGGIESTVHDLAKWNQALYGGKILNAKSLALMTIPHAQVTPAFSYGYGLFIGTIAASGEKYFFHSGGIPGFSSSNSFYPSKNKSVIVLSNCMSSDSAYFASSLKKIVLEGHALLPMLMDDPSIAPFKLDAYVGSYSSDTLPLDIEIRLQEGRLYMEIEGQLEHRLLIHGVGKFYDRALDADVTFSQTNFDEFQLDVSGQVFHFKRKP